MNDPALERIVYAVRGALYMLLITMAFYIPAQWLIPDELSWQRWGVWALGWTGAFVVQWFIEWYQP